VSTKAVWVFGYGSLVSPESFAETVGRPLQPGVDFHEATLTGYGRRWNYGVQHTVGRHVDSPHIDRTIVALGIVPASGEAVNGVVGRVDERELAALDRRERHYDRVDVTRRVTVATSTPHSQPIVVYVPRGEAIAHYEVARDLGLAAIEQRYWDLVDQAFAALGEAAHARYLETTPAPDVPVLPLDRR
jgi:cation transport regulator ChaC